MGALRKAAVAVGVLGLGCGGVFGAGFVWAGLTGIASLDHPDTPYPEGLVASDDPVLIERGRYLVHGPAHCASCHSESDRHHPERTATEPLHGGLAFELGPIGTLYARNLTPDPETGIGRRTDAELARVLRTGVLPEGQLSIFMRTSASRLGDEDVVAVLSYLRAQEPVRNPVPPNHVTFLGSALVKVAFSSVGPRTSAPPIAVQAGEGPTVERGAYLADHVMLCTGCHSAYDPATFESVGPKAGGGICEASHGDDSDMEYCPPNLTSAPTGVTGRLDEDAFVERLRAGRRHISSIMPWEGVGNTSEDDLRSVYRYLRSLPPVDVDTGPSYRPVGWTPQNPP